MSTGRNSRMDGQALLPNRRWYDQEPSCSRLLEQIRSMPHPEAREFCARVVIHFCDKVRRESGKTNMGVHSVGPSALSSLYRFGAKKRRWYDQEAAVQKAVGMFYTLSPEGLGLVGFKLGDTFGLIQVYAAVCQQVDQPPESKELTRICTTSLQAGRKEAEDVLVSIVGKELYDSLSVK